MKVYADVRPSEEPGERLPIRNGIPRMENSSHTLATEPSNQQTRRKDKPMQATDEQISRVKHASFHFGGLPTSAAIDAVLAELAALRTENEKLKDAISRLKGNS